MRFKYAIVIIVCCIVNSAVAEGDDNQVFNFSFTDNYSSGNAMQYAIDTNDSYTTGNGQPSVIWRGSITVGSEKK